MTSNRYDLLSIALHWLSAALVVGLVLLGKVMTGLGNGFSDLAVKFQLYQLHKSLGFLLLATMVVRIGWAAVRPAPASVAFGSAFERYAARTVHFLIYATLIALPVTGWALVSTATLRVPTRLFGVLPVPHLPWFAEMGAADRSFYEQTFRETHDTLATILLVLIAAHAAAALRHHLWLKDGTLMRMLPWGHRAGR